jgi:VCBS repeat-containing protein
LLEGEKKTDSFSYEVSADSTRSTRANLDIEVSGVNDVATITTKYGTRTQITNGSLGAAVASDAIIVSDADVDQNDLSTATAVAGAFGLLDLPASTTVGQYGWKYSTSGTKNKSDTIQHDLFTLTSKDGTASTTLDFQLQATSTVTKHVAVGQDKTLDTLMLDTSAGFTLDLTSVERIDITGGQNVINAIQLSLANLTQADNHLLEVVGDSADTVDLSQLKLFLDPAHASTQGVSGVYYVRSNSIDYELHVVNAQVLGLI